MKEKEPKLFNKPILVLIVILTFVFNYYTMEKYAERFEWEGGPVYIFRKSVNNPMMFLVWVFIIPIVTKLHDRFPYTRAAGKNLLWHLLFSIVITLFVDSLSWIGTGAALYLFDTTFSKDYFQNYFDNIDLYFFNLSYTGVIIYWLVIIYLSSISYYKKYRNETIKRTEAESLIAKAELNALKMQVQPHFLFNTLHSISSLIDENTEEAQDVIGRLGDLMRYTLDQRKTDFVTLKTELEFIENYLEIERVRFKERLMVHYQVDKTCESIFIAGFILQPLIENAIKHGFAKTNRKCNIVISAALEAQFLNITITDDGNGSEVITKGVGLENTENRLKNYYVDHYEFNYQNTQPHGFKVVMKIPAKYEIA